MSPADTVATVDPELPRVFTRAQALERGFTRRAIDHRLARRRWRRILPSVYTTCDRLGEYDRYAAALLFAGPGSALSGAAALRVSEVGRIALPARVLVLVPPETHVRPVAWVQLRRTCRPIVLERWTGPRRVLVARATADYALASTRLDDVRAVVARVLSERRCTPEELRGELDAGPRKHSALLRQVLDEVGASRSAPEVRAARILRSAGLGGFVQNERILLPNGRYYEADFLWPELRAVLEIDSREFHFEPAAWGGTMDRHLAITTAGYSLVHRPPSALKNEARFVDEIGRWLVGRRAELGLAPR